MPFAVPWRKAFLFQAVLALLLFPSFGFAYLGMGSMGGQGNCPFMPGHSAALCQANPVEHIQELQSMFNTLPQSKTVLAMLVLLVAAVAVMSFFKNLFSPPLILALASVPAYRFTPPRNVLQEAYSCGILNPKVF